MLRKALIALGVLYLVVAAVLLAIGHVGITLAVYLVVSGSVLIGGILIERRRYRPRVDRTHGPWQLTGERFVDPSSGRLMEVHYNPLTGERDYVADPNRPSEIAAPRESATHDSRTEVHGSGE